MSKILKLNPFYSEKYGDMRNVIYLLIKMDYVLLETALLDSIGNALPIIINVIQANDTLSVQVHPDDKYSKIHENDNSKT